MNAHFRRCAVWLVILSPLVGSLMAAEPPKTGPETEKRFPPLTVPAGFKATLFACDPLVEYPSVIAAGPKPGAVFVAYDYMTGLGTEIIRRDEVRLVEDTDGDGYADKSTVYAKGFNSIMGLAYHNGTVYVMHAPFLTALRDTKGTGVADERKDLLTGLGLEPEKNPVRLHCANGVAVGHDGWLYLAMGDNGLEVPRPEGDRLVLNGGGILRCRPDGRDAHVFASGLRNIYDVTLDAELNVFTRDNENDGGTYLLRVCHSFHGADHGYPYLYEDRPDEGLRPLADLGRGSSAGVVCYLEQQFPPQYHGNLFCCEWGKSLVRYAPKRQGSSFGPVKEDEFAVGASNDPYGFKPTDVVVQRDGTLIVSDWCDGQRPLRGRGRIYHLAYVGERAKKPARTSRLPPELASQRFLQQLDSDSYAARCEAQTAMEAKGHEGLKLVADCLANNYLDTHGRLHAIWILVHLKGAAALEDLFKLAKSDAEPIVRAQAVRAIADLADAVLVKHKLDAGLGDEKVAARLAELDKDQSPMVTLEIIVALGRLKWVGLPDWLGKNESLQSKMGLQSRPDSVKEPGKAGTGQETHPTLPDAALAHAIQQALRRCENWPATLKFLDRRRSDPLRAVALRAMAERYEPVLVDGIVERLQSANRPTEIQQYADLLTRVHRKPGRWVYWGYRPGPRPVNPVPWEKTERIAAALTAALARTDNAEVRAGVLERMQREKVPVALVALSKWLLERRDATETAASLALVADHSELAENARGGDPAEIQRALRAVAGDNRHSLSNRLVALAMLEKGLDEASAGTLLTLAEKLEDGPVMVDAVRRLAKHPKLAPEKLLIEKLSSKFPPVRAAALESLTELKSVPAGDRLFVDRLFALLVDDDPQVRRAAAKTAGKFPNDAYISPLLSLVYDADPAVRRASFGTLSLVLKDGTLQAGVKIDESDATLTLVDNQGIKRAVPKDEIDERTTSPLSTMPEGFEKRFTENEFVDLLTFLGSLQAKQD